MGEKIKNVALSFKTILPWWSDFRENFPLTSHTESSSDLSNHPLNRFYFYSVAEIAVSNYVEDIPKFINERYQNILAAAYSSGLSVATLIKGTKGRVEVSLGFVADLQKKIDPDVFLALLKGVLPGGGIQKQTLSLSSLVKEMPHGGLITGIPALKNDDERQRFNISSVVRSLYGNEYTLLILASPVDRVSMQESFRELLNFRDQCHENKIKNISKEHGQSDESSKSFSTTSGKSHTGSLILYSYSSQESITEVDGESTGTTVSDGESFERQSGRALELEKIADHFIERMIRGFNVGYWETVITFAAKTKTACDILGGSFIGELSKPSEKLYPPRCYIGDINPEHFIFLPCKDSASPIFPKSLASYLTSEELSQIASPPTESLPGFEIKKMPSLCLTDIVTLEDQESPSEDVEVGHIADYGNPIPGSSFTLTNRDLNKHLFVCGITGSGKTTTVRHILKSIYNRKSKDQCIPFLVLESAKRDYRQLLADEVFKKSLRIYTVGDATVSPIRLNPFYIQQGVHPLNHIDYLKAIFNASFSLYGPMPHILEKCLHNIYLKRGWNLTSGLHPHFVNEKGEYDEDQYNTPEHHYCFPTLVDLKLEVDSYVNNELGYKGELRDNIRTAIIVRLESLCVGAKGLMFNTYEFHTLENLLGHPTILEMENLADDDDKAFFVGLMLVAISEYRQRDNPAINPGRGNRGLQHLLVIEEAHRLLKNVSTERSSEMMGNPKGKAVEVFCNVISEMRSLGQGVVVVEQIPSKISLDVIKNSNTKIVHRLVAKDDQELLAGSLSLSTLIHKFGYVFTPPIVRRLTLPV